MTIIPRPHHLLPLFPAMKDMFSCICLILFLTLCASPSAQAMKIKRKGRFLHTEILGFADKTSFEATLYAKGSSSFPTLKINRLTVRTIKEIKVFETVIDSINGVDGPQEVRDYRDLEVIPNEFIKDNPSTRQDIIHEGPFKNTSFTIDGHPYTTDAQGLVEDSKQLLLARFDDLTLNSIIVTISHPTYGEKTATFTRLVMKPEEKILPDYRKHDPKATLDVLESMGIDSSLPGNPTRNALEISCNIPTFKTGDLFPITVKVTNNGSGMAGNLLLCTFSREDWLDGKLFYFGNLPPKQTRTFVRLVKSPSRFTSGTSALTIASWDTVRAQPEHALNLLLPHE